METEKTPAVASEKPQSPAVVKAATDTKAKPKTKPAPETHKETSPETSGKSKRDFVDDAFSVFGWGD